jgi:hypothetical protein
MLRDLQGGEWDGLVLADGPEGGVYPAPAGAVDLDMVRHKDTVAMLDLLMTEFDGVSEEFALMCRLPWGAKRYGAALSNPLVFWREQYRDANGTVHTRVFVTDNGFDAWMDKHALPKGAASKKLHQTALRQC